MMKMCMHKYKVNDSEKDPKRTERESSLGGVVKKRLLWVGGEAALRPKHVTVSDKGDASEREDEREATQKGEGCLHRGLVNDIAHE